MREKRQGYELVSDVLYHGKVALFSIDILIKQIKTKYGKIFGKMGCKPI